MTEGAATQRTRIRRNAKRAAYSLDEIHAVLDSNLVCHVAYVEQGEPRLIPTLHLRRDDYLFLHGNRQAAMLRHLAGGGLAAVSVTTLDGVVVARSGFHCSMNYRSAVVFGQGEPVPEADVDEVLDAFVARLIPGHERAVRAPTRQERAATAVVRLPITEASAKIRSGDAIDDPADLDSDVWAGVIPLFTATGAPVPNADLKAGVHLPDYVAGYRPPA